MKSNNSLAPFGPTKIFIGAFFVLIICLSSPADAEPIFEVVIDCNVDTTICTSDEVCYNGYCVSLDKHFLDEKDPDQFQFFPRDVDSLEELFSDYETENSDTPIRVHKYEVDPDDYELNSQSDLDDRSDKADLSDIIPSIYEEPDYDEDIIELDCKFTKELFIFYNRIIIHKFFLVDKEDLDDILNNYEIEHPYLNLKRVNSDLDQKIEIEDDLDDYEKQFILDRLAGDNNVEVLIPPVDTHDEDENDESDENEATVNENQEQEEVKEGDLNEILVDAVENELEKANMLEEKDGKELIDILKGI